MNDSMTALSAVTCIGLALILLGVLVSGLINMQPDAQDLIKCMELTNYSAERCEWEMTR